MKRFGTIALPFELAEDALGRGVRISQELSHAQASTIIPCIATALNVFAHRSPQKSQRQLHHGASAEGVEHNDQFGSHVSRMRPRNCRTCYPPIFFMWLNSARTRRSGVKNPNEAEFPGLVSCEPVQALVVVME